MVTSSSGSGGRHYVGSAISAMPGRDTEVELPGTRRVGGFHERCNHSSNVCYPISICISVCWLVLVRVCMSDRLSQRPRSRTHVYTYQRVLYCVRAPVPSTGTCHGRGQICTHKHYRTRVPQKLFSGTAYQSRRMRVHVGITPFKAPGSCGSSTENA